MRKRIGSDALLASACLFAALVPAETRAADVAGFAAPTLVFGEETDISRAVWPGRTWQVDFGEQADVPATLGSGSWRVDFGAEAAAATAERDVALDLSAATAMAIGEQAPAARPVAYVYSDGYELRARIHRYASVATLPMFAVQAVLGVQLDDRTSGGVRSAHSAVAMSMAGLFGVNSVTGVWNLWEGRKNPAGRRRRLLHGALMLVADAGFVATGMLAPNDEGGNSSTHRRVALSSIAVATTGYLIMLFGQ